MLCNMVKRSSESWIPNNESCEALGTAVTHESPGIEREQYPVTKRFMFVGLSIWGTRLPPRGESCHLRPGPWNGISYGGGFVWLSVCLFRVCRGKSVTGQQSPVSRFNGANKKIAHTHTKQELCSAEPFIKDTSVLDSPPPGLAMSLNRSSLCQFAHLLFLSLAVSV